jgi:hypothetical protein
VFSALHLKWNHQACALCHQWTARSVPGQAGSSFSRSSRKQPENSQRTTSRRGPRKQTSNPKKQNHQRQLRRDNFINTAQHTTRTSIPATPSRRPLEIQRNSCGNVADLPCDILVESNGKLKGITRLFYLEKPTGQPRFVKIQDKPETFFLARTAE